MSDIKKAEAIDLFRKMCEIREFENSASENYRDGNMPGFIHLSIGQEACAVGACAALEPEDYITSTHRGHGHCLAKGADPKRMMAELFARDTGYSKGRGGSMHIADMSKGILGANGIVGQSLPLAVGAALTSQTKHQGRVSMAFFGEGASGSGVAHEAMNMAALWNLPVIFFCEVNRYAELSPFSVHCPIENISDRASAYGFPGKTVNGEDVIEVYECAKLAVSRAKQGKGPSLIEAKAFRWHGHYEGDPQKYKTPEERDSPHDFDPLEYFAANLAPGLGIKMAELAQIKAEEKKKIQDAIVFAKSSPPARLSAIAEDVFDEVR